MKKLLLLVPFLAIMFNGCLPEPEPEVKKPKGFSFLSGTVIKKSPDTIIVTLNNEEFFQKNDFENRVAREIVINSFLNKKNELSVSGYKAKVVDIIGTQATFKIVKNRFKVKENVKIFVPTKRLAIIDFEVLHGNKGFVENVMMENITSILVRSGKFTVVERNKLNTVLGEQKINVAQPTPKSASAVGENLKLMPVEETKEPTNLVEAEILLTGTFIQKGDRWNANFRLVDVKTGVILGAVKESVSEKELN